jgi:hypothetical protein
VVSGGSVTEANYVTLGTPVDLQFTNDVNFSVAFWTRFTGSPGDLPFLANDDNSYGDPGVTIAPSYNQGAWSWYLNDAGAAVWQGIGLYAPVQNTLNDGAWHHLLYTFNRAGNATVYRDGAVENQTRIAQGVAWNLDTGKPWNIGQASGNYPEAGTFEMDDMGIWRRVLTSYEAASIYAAGQISQSFDVYGPVRLNIQLSGGNVDLSWQAGTLLQSTNVSGPYAAVPGAAPPFYRTSAGGAAMFLRVQQ